MGKALLVFRADGQETRRLQEAAGQEYAAKARPQAAMDRYTDDFATSAAGVMESLVCSAATMRGTRGEISAAVYIYPKSGSRLIRPPMMVGTLQPVVGVHPGLRRSGG